MALDIETLAKDMFNAAFGVLKGKSPAIGNYVRGECAKIAQQLATIETERATGEISDDEARILVEMQKNASRSVLTTGEGLALLDAEQAINAALDVVRATVNTALGFALL